VTFLSLKPMREVQSVHQGSSPLSEEAQEGIARVNPREEEPLLFLGRVDEIYLGDIKIPHSHWMKEKEQGC
jgi:hypothetical protein